MATQYMDVYFIRDSVREGVFTCADVQVRRSWDGSLYAETNCMDFAGPSRRISLENLRSPMFINGQVANCYNWDSWRLLEEGHQD